MTDYYYIAYHVNAGGPCVDGELAAQILVRYLEKKGCVTEPVPVLYGVPIRDQIPEPDSLKASVVHLVCVDICPDRDEYEYLRAKMGLRFHVIDHHDTRSWVLEVDEPDDIQNWVATSDEPRLLPNLIFGTYASAAYLVWCALYQVHPNRAASMPPIIRYVSDRDTWRFELPFSRAINAALRIERETGRLNFTELLEKDLDQQWAYLAALAGPGAVLCDAQDAIVAEIAKEARLFTYPVAIEEKGGGATREIEAMVVFSPLVSLRSEVGAYLNSQLGAELAIVVRLHEGVWHFDLRSKKADIHCGKIAERYGGGGHAGAGGFKSDPTEENLFIQELFRRPEE